MKYTLSLVLLLILTACSAAPETPTETPPEPEEKVTIYQDDYVSFSYPEEVYLVVESNPEGRLSRTIQFVYWDEETSTYAPVGVMLQFPYNIRDAAYPPESENNSYEAIYNAYKEAPGMETTDYEDFEDLNFGSVSGFVTRTGGLGPHYYVDLYVPFTEEEFGDNPVYKLTRDALIINEELYDEAIEMFIETAEFYK